VYKNIVEKYDTNKIQGADDLNTSWIEIVKTYQWISTSRETVIG
jgi:hypothetical protein